MVSLATRVQVSKPAKLLVAGLLLFLIYVIYSYRGIDKEISHGSGKQPVEEVEKPPEKTQIQKLVLVDVYYETLCPDSRYFVSHELMPAYNKLGDVLDVRLWPYGKANTINTSDGGFQINCQHGDEECEGNIWHGCTSRYVSDQATRLNMVKCMIEDNYEAPKVAKKCAQELGVDLAEISVCATGEEGLEIHRMAGLATDQLQPKVSFIPTIKLEGTQGSQKAILKNFLKEVCNVYTSKYQEVLEGCQ